MPDQHLQSVIEFEHFLDRLSEVFLDVGSERVEKWKRLTDCRGVGVRGINVTHA